VQHLVHLRLAEEEIGAAVVRDEEAVAVRMPLHGAGDEIELRGDAELALAIDEELAIALHRRRCGRRMRRARACRRPSLAQAPRRTSGTPAALRSPRIAAREGSNAGSTSPPRL
jgi:hypothetical protein